jgi:hypothetical protein
MKKRTIWYLLVGVLCCSLGVMSVNAAQTKKDLPGLKNAAVKGKPALTVTRTHGAMAGTTAKTRHSESPREAAAREAHARWLQTGTASLAEKELMDEFYGQPSNSGSPLDNTGGPDAYGYRYVDNVAPDTATYSWIELQGATGTNYLTTLDGQDDATATITNLGISFLFYGNTYSSATVCTNGSIQFNSSDAAYTETCPPALGFGTMGATLFPYWDDLNAAYGGRTTNVISWKNFGNYTVIEFDSIGHCCAAGTSLKFEAILFSDGKIKLQYNNLVQGSYPNTQVIGIQAAGTAGSTVLTYVCDATGIQPANGRAIWFYPGAPSNGRCCYGNPQSPSCQDVLPAACAALGGTWSGNMTCANNPCPILPPNDNCTAVTPVTLPATFTGDNTLATHDCALLTLGEGETWHAFTTTECMNVTVSYCGVVGPAGPWGDVYIVFANACPCGSLIYATNWSQSCGDLNWSVYWNALPAGTYYVPVLREASTNSYGPYSINVSGVACPPAPPNDNCSAVTPVTLPATFTGNNSGATEDCALLGAGEGEAWEAFTITQDMTVTIDYCGTVGPNGPWGNFYWVVVSGCPCGSYILRDTYNFTSCADGNITFAFTDLPPGTYYIPILSDIASGSYGAYTIHVSGVPFTPPTGRCCYNIPVQCAVNTQTECNALSGIWTLGLDCNTTCPTPPANDLCANAVHLTGDYVALPFDNTLCNPTADNSSCGMGHDLWYCWSTTCEVDVNVTTCGSAFDTKLALFNTDVNCTCPGATDPYVLCNDDTCGLQSAISWHALPGKYMIEVGGFSTSAGTGVLNITTSVPCSCDSATAVTVYTDPNNAGHVWLHYYAPNTSGRYKIYSTTNKNNNGHPVGNPDFTLEAAVVVGSVGTQVWSDPSVVAAYKNYVVIHDCAAVGRCCYGDIFNPSCATNTATECAALTGTWTSGITCTTPCPAGPQYCAAGANTCDEYIASVVLNDLSNATACTGTGNYNDYTAMSAHLNISTPYTITVLNGPNLYYPSDSVEVYVDWNTNGSFSDAGEFYTTTTTDAATYTGTITPPVGSSGSHRMRIRMSYASAHNPCGTETYGEVEDYTVIVP